MTESAKQLTAVKLKSLNKDAVRKNTASFLVGIFKYVFIIVVGFVFFYPFLYMIITSVKSPEDLASTTIQWIPKQIYFDNFRVAAAGLKYGSALKNSVIITVLCTAGHLISCSLAGYAVARYKNKLTTVLTVLIVLSIIVPVQVIIMPQYLVFSKLKWINTFLPLIIPSFLGFGLRGGLFVFIFRQFYTGIPKEIEEAARVDGCKAGKTFLKIIIPSSSAPMLVCGILSMVWHWNDSYLSSTFITNYNMSTLAERLPKLYEVLTAGTTSIENMHLKLIYNEAVIMAATLLVILPVLVVFFILQRRFMEGIERSGIVG